LLNDVIANFLSTLSEIEFFDAFAALLRANDFYDVHLTHGSSEHGKDFIAKRREKDQTWQYAIQTKAGDVNTRDWREARLQIDTIRTTNLSHPSFDHKLPRRAVLAATGRLVGVAPTESQDYKVQYDSESFEFDVWQLNDLLVMMTDAPEAGLAGEPNAPLLGAVAAIFEGTFDEAALERLSRGWCAPAGDLTGIWRAALSALVLAHRLSINKRKDLAALTGAHLIRAAWARCGDQVPPPAQALAVADAGRGLLIQYSLDLYANLKALPVGDPEKYVMATASFGDTVVYPVRSSRIIELLGLVALGTEDTDLKLEISAFCADFVRQQPGASHPISDHWAVSIPPAALALFEFDRPLLGRWMQEVCVWVLDHYENGQAGLAAPWSAPSDEVVQLLVSGLPVPVQGNPDSFLASVLLDLSSALELETVYDSVINDVLAVRICPSVVEADEGPGFYQDNFGDVFIEPWVIYDGHYNDEPGWQSSGPHRRSSDPYLLRIGRPWDLMALSSVLRDRWYPRAWRALVNLVE
jgi:hypothetical protein